MAQRRGPPDPATARNAALRALVRREHSARELASKLQRRGYGADTAADAVDALAQRGLQSDERFAELLVRTRLCQGFGPQRIAHELAAAGVPDALAAAALAAADCDWRALAVDTWRRKFRTPPGSASEWQKHYRYLAGRGFEPEQIYAALKEPPEGERIPDV